MLERFLQAQSNGIYERALSEIQSGAKRSHWMWFIFPQLEGLGYSPTAQYYSILNREVARAYINHPVLGKRLIEISQAIYALDAIDIRLVLGYPDYLKFQSCMTLFALVAPEHLVFQHNLQRYFRGEKCRYTENHL